MDTKKAIYFDPNSYLVPFFEKELSTIMVSPNLSLWDQLVLYYKGEGEVECEYLLGHLAETVVPRFSYKRESHNMVVDSFEKVCVSVKHLLVDDFFTGELIRDFHKEQLNPSVSSSQTKDPKKRRFFWRKSAKDEASLADLAVYETPVNKVSGELEIGFGKLSLDLSQYQQFENVQDINKVAPILASANSLSLSQAREQIFYKSYQQKAACANMLARMQNEQVAHSGKLNLTLNLKFLADSGFLSLASLQNFKKSLLPGYKLVVSLDPSIFLYGFKEENREIDYSSFITL